MFAPLVMLVNFFWATLCFITAAVLAIVVAYRLSTKGQVTVGAIAILVGIGVGFSMMGQCGIDHYGEHRDAHERIEEMELFLKNTRPDQICRAAMRNLPAVRDVIGRERTALLDIVSYNIAPRAMRCYGRDAGQVSTECLTGATLLYLLNTAPPDNAHGKDLDDPTTTPSWGKLPNGCTLTST